MMPLRGGGVRGHGGREGAGRSTVAVRADQTAKKKVDYSNAGRLPVGSFDPTKSGVLISRIMPDAGGIRNLVANGLVQLVGSLVTAVLALAYLFYLNWVLTCVNIIALGSFGAAMAIAFNRL